MIPRRASHTSDYSHTETGIRMDIVSYRAEGTDRDTYVTRRQDSTKRERGHDKRGRRNRIGYGLLSSELFISNLSLSLMLFGSRSVPLAHTRFDYCASRSNLNCHRRFARAFQSAPRPRIVAPAINVNFTWARNVRLKAPFIRSSDPLSSNLIGIEPSVTQDPLRALQF